MKYLNLLFIFGFLVLAGCAPTGRYYQQHDSAPSVIPSKVTTEDAKPEYTAYHKATLRPYTIRGVNYRPLHSAKGYSAEGGASWYGQKFHGHRTANGEIYDMYQMSAAHKTLPLPSFVRVTNLENGKQVVVRVNDRGPFHSGRVIDLSYAAALKLDMLKTGTSKVKVDVMHVDKTGQLTVGRQPIIATDSNAQSKPKVFIQVAALRNKHSIDKLANGLEVLYQRPYHAKYEKNIYKLRLGPLPTEADADQLLLELKNNGYPSAYKIYLD